LVVRHGGVTGFNRQYAETTDRQYVFHVVENSQHFSLQVGRFELFFGSKSRYIFATGIANAESADACTFMLGAPFPQGASAEI
jgi:hypothetical protein